jgi:pimeloyl-ACP methyl ester carboxylesterase
MKYLIYILIAASVLLSACTQSEFLTAGDYFHLDHKGAKLPVWVKGNINSGVFLITVHGGPGASGHEFPLSHGFQYLEEDYAIVYWDQRFSGLSQGDPDLAEISAELFIEDTEQIVELIRQKYNPDKLFMLGHSWGGQLSAGYLGRDKHADLFDGWIDLDGSLYGELESVIMKDWILDQVPAKLADENSDQEFWQFVLDWYDAHPQVDNYTDFEPYIFASSLDGYAYDWAKTQELNPTPYKDLIFSSMFSFAFYTSGIPVQQTWVDTLNFTPELHHINIPSLLLWGKQDGAVPAALADYVYMHLATDSTMKHLVILDECSHSPHYDQPDRFYQEVKTFIETYK